MIHAERPLAYVVALDLAARGCVVIGGGSVAASRVAQLLDAGARVTVIAPSCSKPLRALAARGDIEWLARAYAPGDLRDAALVLNTTADEDVEAAVREEATREGALLNTHDRPSACDFAMPALLRRGRLQVAVSTSGDSPHVASTVRDHIGRVIGEEWGAQLSVVARVRRRLRHARAPLDEQVATYRRLMRQTVRDALRRNAGAIPVDIAGAVHIVGAGPGDPDLLTLRARDLLATADIVFHDALVPAAVLALRGRHTRLVDVGKRAGGARTSQDDINAMLIAAARAGEDVVRLKGGDPFVFGRGGEELAALCTAGIPAEVVPGVTAAFAAPAAAGIPVTHRGVSTSVAVITGHDSDGRVPANLEALASAVDTLVLLMPLNSLDAIAQRLAATLSPSCPAAVIAGATTETQHTVRGTLSTIAQATHAVGVTSPATLVVGQVVTVLSPAGIAPVPV